MKKLLLHIILLSYAIAVFKPVFPYIKDTINHLLFYKQHMATVHFENGKYHVHAEVEKNTKEDDSNKNTTPIKKQNTTNEHIFFLENTTISYKEFTKQKYPLASLSNLAIGAVAYNYPPPRI